jgi:hypothetical protein
MGNAMILLKSILAGLLAVLIAAIVLPMVIPMVVGLYLSSGLPPDKSGEVTVGFDPVTAARSPVTWIVGAIVFSLGFCWEYRRLKGR